MDLQGVGRSEYWSLQLAKEKLCTLLLRVVRRRYGVPNGTLMAEYLVIVAPHKGFVTEKVDFVILGRINELETVRLVPSSRKDIKTDLTSNTVREIQIAKLFAHGRDHGLAHLVLQVEYFIVVALLARTVASNGRNVEHATAKLKKRAPLLQQQQDHDQQGRSTRVV
jgi:hypothetical protein